MKRTSAIALVVVFACAALAAQGPPPTPTPGPEQKNLAYFIGNWKLEGEIKPGPMGPGGKFTSTEHDEWLPGGFFVVGHSQGTSSMGKEIALAIYGYDSTKKVYTFDEFNNAGQTVHATGAFDGKVWTWSSESTMGGQNMKGRFILTETSPTAYDFKFELSQDGNTWSEVFTGKGSKTGGATKKAAGGASKK